MWRTFDEIKAGPGDPAAEQLYREWFAGRPVAETLLRAREPLVFVVKLMESPKRRLESVGPEERVTQREREVLRLIAEGRTNQQIGGELHITEGTAALHISRMLGNLDVKTRGQAATIARRVGLVDESADV